MNFRGGAAPEEMMYADAATPRAKFALVDNVKPLNWALLRLRVGDV